MIAPFINIFTSPKKAFSQVDKHTSWMYVLVPIIFVVLSSALFQTLPSVKELIDDKKVEILVNQTDRILGMDISKEQKEEILTNIEKQINAGESPFMQFVIAPVILFLMMLIVSGIIWIGGNFVYGGDVIFFKNLNIVGISLMIMAFAIFAKIPLILAMGSLDLDLSPAIFTFGFDEKSFLLQFLRKFSVFNIWIVSLLSVGFSVIYKVGIDKGLYYNFGVWVIVNLILTGIGQYLIGLTG